MQTKKLGSEVAKVTRFRKLNSSHAAAVLAVASTRRRGFSLLWSSRKTPYIEVTDGISSYFPPSFLSCIPVSTEGGTIGNWPEYADDLAYRLAVPIVARRVTYLSSVRVKRGGEPARKMSDVLDRVLPDVVGALRGPENIPMASTVGALRDMGFALVPGGGGGRLPYWLGYIGDRNREERESQVGQSAAPAILEAVDHLWQRVANMRYRDPAPRGGAWVYAWDRFPDEFTSPRHALRNMGLLPEIWIRRRIARRSSILSLSVYGVRPAHWTPEDPKAPKRGRPPEGTSVERWEVVDLTALVALHATGADRNVLWRRAVYLVERGDGLEWIVSHPDHDGMEFVRNSPRGSGVPDETYEGSPARHVVSSLNSLFPAPGKPGEFVRPRVRWLRDDAPLKGAGEVV
jgi:hypothetical protein